MRKLASKRLILWVAGAVAAFATFGFLVLPPILKSVLVSELSKRLHRPVSIRAIRINPFALSVRVEGFSMGNRDGSGPFFAFEELFLNAQAASLVTGGPVIREILLRAPSVVIARNEDSSYNFSDLLEEFASRPSGDDRPLRYSLNNIRIVGGRIDFDDRPKRARHIVRDLNVAIPFLSNMPYAVNVYVRPTFAATVNGTAVALRGTTRPYSESRDSSVNLKVRALDIPRYLEYLPARLKFRVPSGSLDADTVLSFSQPAGKSPSVAISGSVRLSNFAVADASDAPVLRLPSLSVAIGSLEPLARRARVDNVVVASPEVSLVRGRTGTLNVMSLLPDGSAAQSRKGAEEPKPGPPLAVEIGAFRLTGGKFSLSDLASPTPFRVSATLDLSARFKAGPGESGDEAAVSGLEASVTALRLRREGEPKDCVNVPEIAVKGVEIDLAGRTIAVAEAATANGAVRLVREKDGTLDLAKLVPASDVAGSAKAAAPPPARTRKGDPPAWLVQVKKAAIRRYTVEVEDRTPRDSVVVTVSPLDVAAEEISTREGSRGKASLAAAVNRTGRIAAGGSVGVNPPAADLAVDIRAIDVIPFRPYLSDRLNVSLTGGTVSAKGRLALETRDEAIRTRYEGSALVTKLAAVDAVSSEEFVRWNSLHLDGVKVATAPLSVAIREIALADFLARIVVTSEGTLNVLGIVRNKEPAAATGTADNAAAEKPPESGARPTPVAIETVSLQGGRINFTDHSIAPAYAADLLEVAGRVSGLSSETTRPADVHLQGRLGNHAPLEITGTINPLRDDLFVDLKVDFRNMDLGPLSPYFRRYAGYAVEKGKLFLNLRYVVAKRRLDAGNNVFLDQFTLGERVESPDATKLPVRLAVALLKNRNGEIRLDLPVSGSLDDPKFRLGRVIVQIIVNLLVKAATSPFALLGAAFGGGEELSYLEFPYGADSLDAPAAAKIDTLAKALGERPSLKLEIAGYVDTEKDREGLRRLLFDRKVRSQKLRDLVRKGAPAPSLDDIVVDAKEYPEYLRRAYRAEKFPKPRNIIGMAKDLPVPEMEKLLHAHLKVTDDDLRLLAQRRARAVKDRLVASKLVEPERIFLVEPKDLAPAKKEKQRDSRVEFVLK